MKWNDVWMLVIPEPGQRKADQFLGCTATSLASRYAVPNSRRVLLGEAMRPLPGFSVNGHRILICDARLSLESFAPATANSLAGVTLGSKLIVVGHACSTSVVSLYPAALVEALSDIGLKQVGLVSFKGCQVGHANFLDSFVKAATGRIQVGWCLGYRDDSRASEHSHMFVGAERFWRWFHPFPASVMKRSDEHRIKVVRGNVQVVPRKPSSRFPAQAPLPYVGDLLSLGG